MKYAPVLAALLATVAFALSLAIAPAFADENDKKDKGESTERLCQGIPCGHLPPPGECRAWIPGKPAGQQSPPGRCDKVEAEAPAGAVIIRGEKR